MFYVMMMCVPVMSNCANLNLFEYFWPDRVYIYVNQNTRSNFEVILL